MFPLRAWIACGLATLVALIACGLRLAPRMDREREHRALTVVLDYRQLATLAQDQGFALDLWLTELRETGFDHLALSEDTPLWLEQRGICAVAEGFFVTKSVPENDTLTDGPQGLETPEQTRARKANARAIINYSPDEKAAHALLNLSPGDLHLLFPEEPTGGNLTAQRIAQAAAERLGAARVSIAERPESGLVLVSLKGDVEDLVELGLGYVSPTARQLKAQGFAVVPRLRNQRALPELATAGKIVMDAAVAAMPGPGILIVEGDEILGFPKANAEVADALERSNLLFGYVEFAKQSGDKALADRRAPAVVRVHSISDEEMEIYTPDRALKRYVLAATERNVRVIYLKPFHIPMQGVDLKEFNTAYFQSVRDALIADGFQLSTIQNGTVTHRLNPWPGMPPLPVPTQVAGLIALGIAVGFPLLALYFLTGSLPSFFARAERGDSFGAIAIALGWLWGWGLLAALLVAALGSEDHFMLQTRSFSGVNLTLLGPVMLGAILWVRVLVNHPPERILDQAVLLGNFPIHVKHLAIGGIVLLAALIVVLRSGNEPVGGIAPIELAFRAFLGDLLDVRPRTKEFLIGHPALVMGLFLLFQRRPEVRPWAYPLLVAGMLGITSVINTFQHFHTPLAISLQRTFVGMTMGLVLGLIGCGVLLLLIRWFYPANPVPVPDPELSPAP